MIKLLESIKDSSDNRHIVLVITLLLVAFLCPFESISFFCGITAIIITSLMFADLLDDLLFFSLDKLIKKLGESHDNRKL